MAPFFMKYSKEKIKEIIDYYLSSKLIRLSMVAKYFNMPKCTVYYLLKKNKIHVENDSCLTKQKFTINQNYFEKIDTEDKAYFLGLLYADGTISGGLRRYTIDISLQESDFLILEKFRDCLCSNKPLTKRIKNKPNHKNMIRLTITNKKLHKDIINLGCVPKKSLILKFPTENQVPNHLLRHFIRGYFDGDGSIYRNKQKNVSIDIYSSLVFNSEVQNVVAKELKIYNIKLFPRKSSHNSGGSFRLHGTNAKCFLDWIYKDAIVYLQRKYNRYVEYYKYNNYGIIELPLQA